MKVTKKFVIEELNALQESLYKILTNTEAAHKRADELLCLFLSSLGHSDIVKEFEKVKNASGKWYS